jgi:Lon protease-like protein
VDKSLATLRAIQFNQLIAVFPLPNVVLFPRAILPLHVFEPRYRLMTHDALASSRLVAVALLRPGFEPRYHTLDVDIYPVVCVGRIIREERLPDGRYNFLLQGLTRAQILQENAELPYRRARLQPLPPDDLPQEHQRRLRGRLQCILTEPPLVELAAETNWADLLKCPDLCLSDLVDLLGSVSLRTVEEKQALLSEPRIELRVKLLCQSLKALGADYFEQCRSRRRGPRVWPPECRAN